MSAANFFKRLVRDMKNLERTVARQVVAVEAQKFHAQNFRKGGFTDRSFKKWKARKKSDKKGNKRALLVDSGAMKRAATKGKINGSKVDFRFSLAYMKVHNEGLRAGRGSGFKMTKRKYIGKSHYLNNQIKRKARILLNRKLNGL